VDALYGVTAAAAAYLRPVQRLGIPIDKRTAIGAFGCVHYEMLTGRSGFHGDTASDTIAAILGHEPDWSALPLETPPGVRRLLQRCLEKDVKRRLRDIGDARLEIEDALSEGVPSERAGGPEQTRANRVNAARRRTRLATLVAAFVAGALTIV